MDQQPPPRWDPPSAWDPPTAWQRPVEPQAAPSPGPTQPASPPGYAWPAPAASEQPVWYPPPPSDPPLVGRERTWVPASHWVALLTTWLGPFVILVTVGESHPRVREHALESLNFEITFWFGMLLSALATFVLVGYVFLVLLPILWVVLRVLATIDAAAGKKVRYPLTVRLVR